MKFYAAVAALILAVAPQSARAQQNPDDQYIGIYNLIQQADSLADSGQPREALADYTQARAELDKFSKVFPGWNATIVNYRLNYIAQKISGLTAQLPETSASPPKAAAPAPSAPAPDAALQSQLAALQSQVGSLQADNQALQARLKEALSARPVAADAGDLAQARAQILSLMKQYDLLRAAAAQMKTERAGAAEPDALKKTQKALADANQKLAEQTRRADKLAQDNKALQARSQTSPDAGSGSLEALRAENALLKKQLAALTTGATGADSGLAKARAQIAALQSTANILRLEKTALESRLRQTHPATENTASPSAGMVSAPPHRGTELVMSTTAPSIFPAPPLESWSQETTPVNSVPESKSVNELPGGSAALVAEAQNFFSAGQFDKAEADYQKVLAGSPNNALVLANLAAIETEENKFSDAETHIKAALAQRPDDAYNLSTYGYLEFRQQKYNDALDALSRAAKLDPKNARIQNYLGVTLSHKGLNAEAEVALRKAIELDPHYGAAHNNLAVAYITGQPPSEALARLEYQKALDNGQPRNPELEKLLADKGAPVNP